METYYARSTGQLKVCLTLLAEVLAPFASQRLCSHHKQRPQFTSLAGDLIHFAGRGLNTPCQKRSQFTSLDGGLIHITRKDLNLSGQPKAWLTSLGEVHVVVHISVCGPCGPASIISYERSFPTQKFPTDWDRQKMPH